MYELGLCCPYDSVLFWDGRDTKINNHWFMWHTLTLQDTMDEEFPIWLCEFLDHINNNNIISKFLSTPQIVQKYEMEDTCLCIIKTIWLKIFQRKYKNYYNKKMSYYKNPKNIRNRAVYGKWI